jgi:hypothetical protein
MEKIKGFLEARAAAFEDENLMPDDCRVLLQKHVGDAEMLALGKEMFRAMMLDLMAQVADFNDGHTVESVYGENITEIVDGEFEPLTEAEIAERQRFSDWLGSNRQFK